MINPSCFFAALSWLTPFQRPECRAAHFAPARSCPGLICPKRCCAQTGAFPDRLRALVGWLGTRQSMRRRWSQS